MDFRKHAKQSYRSAFLTIKKKDEILMKKIGYDMYCRDARDKYAFYLLTQPFFHRDAVKIHTSQDREQFLSFANKHPNFITKPLDGQCGQGVKIYKLNDSTEANSLFNDLLSQGCWIVEEVINQAEEIKIWNPDSVNTVRMPSFLNKNGQHAILRPFFRTGRKGSIVDNGAAGGIFACINEADGVINSCGYDEIGGKYTHHPDSGLAFKQFKIPYWNELVKTVQNVHKRLPKEHIYMAFDFALTPKGWVLIEGNWGQFLSEFALKDGLKKKFTDYVNGIFN